MPSRRKLLAATGVAIGLAGCSDITDSGTRATEETNESSSGGIQLGEIRLQGTDGTEPHSVQVAVEDDAGVVHLDTYAVEPGEPPVYVEKEWDDDHAEYHINVRVGGQQRRRIDVVAQTERAAGCTDLLILLAGDGEITVWDRSCDGDSGDAGADDENASESE